MRVEWEIDGLCWKLVNLECFVDKKKPLELARATTNLAAAVIKWETIFRSFWKHPRNEIVNWSLRCAIPRKRQYNSWTKSVALHNENLTIFNYFKQIQIPRKCHACWLTCWTMYLCVHHQSFSVYMHLTLLSFMSNWPMQRKVFAWVRWKSWQVKLKVLARKWIQPSRITQNDFNKVIKICCHCLPFTVYHHRPAYNPSVCLNKIQYHEVDDG